MFTAEKEGKHLESREKKRTVKSLKKITLNHSDGTKMDAASVELR